MIQKIVILDFGSPATQNIARSLRALQIYCEILPGTKAFEWTEGVKGIILTDSPMSVENELAPHPDISKWANKVPILGIGFGAQLIALQNDGQLKSQTEAMTSEISVNSSDVLLKGCSTVSSLVNFHSITQAGNHSEVLIKNNADEIWAFKSTKYDYPVYGIQFEPIADNSSENGSVIANFAKDICVIDRNFTPEVFIEDMIRQIQNDVGNQNVVMALSGGVDSSVAATLIHRAIGDQLHCVFVDHGLLRKNEFEEVLTGYSKFGLNIHGINAAERYYKALEGIEDPEQKRKIIGGLFIDIFQEEALKIPDVKFLGQGTIYPDVIESVPIYGKEVVVKSHHNVGGLPEKMDLKLIEPLRYLFKDEVRKIGIALGIEEALVQRHPFPGPGLGVRILGAITPEKASILQEADHIYIQHLRQSGYYNKVWQAGAVLLPIRTVGVRDGQRTYDYVVALRAVQSVDALTADWIFLPHELLEEISDDILQNVKGVNRVVYDISKKPPATIEWE